MKVFYHSLVDFFISKKFLFLAILLAFIIPRVFYGAFVYYYGDSAFYYFSLGKLLDYIDSFVRAGSAFGLNDKKVIYILSMTTTFLIGVGIFRKGYLFCKSKIAAAYTLLIYLIHPLSVWYSGEPRVEHFTHSIFIAGLFLALNQNKKLLWKNFLAVSLLFIATKADPNLYPYTLLFFIFNIFEAVAIDSKTENNNFILIGQALSFVFCALIFLGWDNLTPLSQKILSEVKYVGSLISSDGNMLLKVLPDAFDEYFRNLMKSFFSPVLILFPIVMIGFGKDLKLSNYSRGLYSFSLLICSMYILEIENLSQGRYEQMYAAIILSILVSSIGCHRLYNRFNFVYVRAFIIFFLPLSLSIGLLARSYRDFNRQQSVIGLMPALEREFVQPNQTLFVPFGHDINAKQFKSLKYGKKISVRKVPYLAKKDFSKILRDHKNAYLFVDDYFVLNFYWPGRFLTEIKDELVLNGLLIKRIFSSKTSRNQGHLFKIEWQK